MAVPSINPFPTLALQKSSLSLQGIIEKQKLVITKSSNHQKAPRIINGIGLFHNSLGIKEP